MQVSRTEIAVARAALRVWYRKTLEAGRSLKGESFEESVNVAVEKHKAMAIAFNLAIKSNAESCEITAEEAAVLSAACKSRLNYLSDMADLFAADVTDEKSALDALRSRCEAL